MGKKWGTFENLPMWKHKTNTKFAQVLAHLKCTYHFQILAWTLERIFIMGSFYSDVELMHKLGK